MADKEEELKLCRVCGQDLPPGGTRAVGVCVWCVAEAEQATKRVPGVGYGRNEEG